MDGIDDMQSILASREYMTTDAERREAENILRARDESLAGDFLRSIVVNPDHDPSSSGQAASSRALPTSSRSDFSEARQDSGNSLAEDQVLSDLGESVE